MTTAEQKKAYDTPEFEERTKKLQHEAVDDKTGGVFVIHKVQLEFIEKLDFKTSNDMWTDEEKEQISKLAGPLSDRVDEFIVKELENNDKLGLLEVRIGGGDFKSYARLASTGSMLREMLSLIK